MDFELYFSLVVLAFALVVVCVSVEHYVAVRWLHKDSLLVKGLKAFEKKHPNLCDNEDAFYCFFKRDAFTRH